MEKLAINGGSPLIKNSFPSWPIWDEKDILSVQEAITSGEWEWRGGTKCVDFAEKFAEMQHVRYALPVANGSVALELALEGLNIGNGDEVIVPDYTFMATAAAPVRRGAKMVLVDIDPETFCMNPDLVEKAITGNTKAIIPVHFGGHPCDMDRIMELAKHHDIHVVEDCAHAHGAIWNDTYVGNFGDISTFSFQASKTLNCGEGGAIVSNNKDLFSRCRSFHDAGRTMDKSVYNHYLSGTNYRTNELQGALLLSQLEKFENQCQKRHDNGMFLTELLSDIEGVRPQKVDSRVLRHGFYLFTFILEADIPREAFKKALTAEGVNTQLEYTTMHSLDFVRESGMNSGDFPNSDFLSKRSIWLRHESLLAERDQISLIAKAIEKVLDNRDQLKDVM